MTRKEFIIHYVLLHKDMPKDDVMVQMLDAGVFDSEEPKVEDEEPTESEEHEECPLYNGCMVVCKTQVMFGQTMALPAGFVCKVTVVEPSSWKKGHTNVSVRVVFKESEDAEERTYKTKRIVVRDEIISSLFKIADSTSSPSVVIDTKYDPFDRGDGVVQYHHTYEVVESTLAK